MSKSSIVYLNVGGYIYTTTSETLFYDKKSLLWDLFESQQLITDKAGNYFIDRDGPTFRHILNYLRLKKHEQRWEAALPNQPDQLAALAEEAEYFRLPELREKAIQLLNTWGGDKMTMSTLFENMGANSQQTEAEYYRQPIYIPSERAGDASSLTE